jgi:hypothetical protein
MPTETLFPYKTFDVEPTLHLSSPVVDGEPAPLLPREGRVSLHDLPADWKLAKLQVRATIPPDAMGSIGARDPRAVLTVHCGPTNLRAVCALEASDGSGNWIGSVELARVHLHERAQLYVTVTGSIDGIGDRWLAMSKPWSVDLQPPRDIEISGGEIPCRWRDFAETENGENPIDPAFHSEISYVDLNALGGPVIYLNEGIEGLRRLLDQRPGRPRLGKAVRETTLDLIAQPALVAMGNAALAAAIPDGSDEVDWPGESWQRGVLESLLPLMYPDRDPSAALVTAVDAMAGGDGALDIQTRLQAAAGRSIKVTNHTLSVLTALEASDGEEAR